MAQRGNVDYGQLRQTARKGVGAQVQMFGGGLTTNGHVAVYNAAGDLVDGGATAGGAGTVTSVGVTMPPEFAVGGSPVTAAGTIAVSKASQPQNLVWASPSGAAGPPVFRALVAADFPAGAGGTVTSVGLAMPAEFAVTNSPVTGAGTLTVSKSSQAQNLVYASPAGAAGVPTFRALGAADIPVATVAALGGVKPDGTTITITAGGVISSAAGSQTPWLQPVNAAGFTLSNVPTITGQAGLTLASNGANVLNLNTNAKTRQTIDSAGHVQINAPDDAATVCTINYADVAGTVEGGWALDLFRAYSSVGDWLGLRFYGGGGKAAGSIRSIAWAGGESCLTFNAQTAAGDGGVNEIMRVRGDGRVGIGTTAPQALVSLAPTLGIKLAVYDGGTATTLYGFGIQNSLLQIITPTSTTRTGIGYGSSAAFNEVLSVAAGGVGVGNTAPSALLDVNGTACVRSWLSVGTFSTPAAGTLLGITTTNPTTPATAIQFTINEQTANPAYGMKLGFYLVPGAQYNGVIQNYSGAAGGGLLLQPLGGTIAIGSTSVSAPNVLDVTGSAIVRGNVETTINNPLSCNAYNSAGTTWNYRQAGAVIQMVAYDSGHLGPAGTCAAIWVAPVGAAGASAPTKQVLGFANFGAGSPTLTTLSGLPLGQFIQFGGTDFTNLQVNMPNGYMWFEANGDSQVKLYYKGSDGVVRSTFFSIA